MLVGFFHTLRRYFVPVSLRELLDLLRAMEHRIVFSDLDEFYLLSRTCLVKDEKHYDRFDRAFSAYFQGGDKSEAILFALIPDKWLYEEIKKLLSKEDIENFHTLGDLEKLLTSAPNVSGTEQQSEDSQTVPGNEPSNRTERGQHRRWDRRRYRNLDDSVQLGTRNLQLALRRLRRFTRLGAHTEIDLDETIRSTAHNGGLLDLKERPERSNQLNVIALFDIGGSMDGHVRTCEQLFTASRNEFKRLNCFYFHNFLYQSVWKDNRRRFSERMPTWEIIRKFKPDTRVLFVGDATMAPYEITHTGGSVEYWNEEPGAVWMARFAQQFEHLVWINPTPQDSWEYFTSVEMVRKLVDGRMFPMTIRGLEEAMKRLSR